MAVRALLVEDNPDDADLLREVLAGSGTDRVDLVAVETLRDGLAELDRVRFDVLLLDLSLPDSQGLATVRRALDHPARIPIIVFTGLDDAELGVEAIHAGAQDYVAKGQSNGPLLRRSIDYAIERHGLLAERTADAQVSTALARVGEALLAGLRTHALLDRLSHVTAEVLGCEAVCTWVLDAAADSYRPAAASSTAAWEEIRGLEVPGAALSALTSTDGEGGVYVVDVRLRQRLPRPLMQMPAGIAPAACLILRRSEQVVGTLLCGYREGAARWTGVQARIAGGLVHVAALALDNAQLVAELEESNAIKTYFAATMSHELRNTVFAIGGFSEMLLDALQREGGPASEKFARAIAERAGESLHFIQAALEVTRSEMRPGDVGDGEVELAQLVEQVCHEIEILRNGRALTLDWHVSPAIPPLRIDPVKLRIVLKNLVGNAVKFTERGSIRVLAEPAGERVRMTIADTGIGIAAEELPHLFEPFRQAHGAVSRRAGGAGLGLYIVQRLVDVLGGTIAVESTPGQGTTFAVEVPLQPPPR
jgi:signal transduction histidine kinase